MEAQTAEKQPVALHGAQCTEDTGYRKDNPYDAIVVGAGIAGLTAARELQHLHRSVLVLEANGRIGGRGFVGSIGPEGVPIDYGGAWIHGAATNPLTGLVDAAGFTRARTDLRTRFYVDDHLASEEQVHVFDEAVEEFDDSLERAAQSIQNQHALAEFACREYARNGNKAPEVCAKLKDMVPNGKSLLLTDLCMAQHPALEPEDYCGLAEKSLEVTSDAAVKYVPKGRFDAVIPLLKANAGPLESAQELERTSAVEAAGFEAGEDDLVDKGLGAFVVKMGEGVPVCTNAPVSEIQYSPAGVMVTADGRTYLAKAAVVTVSVGVLKAGRIAFEPPLPERKMKAIESLQMGNMQKVIVPFREDVFASEHENSWVLYEGKLPKKAMEFAGSRGLPVLEGGRFVMAFVFKPLGKPMAIGFFGGDWAKALESQCRNDRTKKTSGLHVKGDCDDLSVVIAQNALETMFGAGKIDAAVLGDQIHVTHWSLDETSLGAYSVAGPREWVEHAVLGEPVKDRCGTERLFFAGEGTARTIYNGSYPGAYESGMKAAREVSEAVDVKESCAAR